MPASSIPKLKLSPTSRVETRRHYTSDVLAGAVIGIAANLAFTRHREHIALSPDLGRGRAGVRLTIVW